MALKTKHFRIAVEGDTTDGRVIERDWLEQMAANYDPKKYTARLNCEHWRGMVPDGDFKAYGSVLALATEEVEIDGEKKLALTAEIEPTADLIALNRKGQKVFTSMEVDTSFASSNEAYLVGLAITDSPASLGTEMLKFAAGQPENPFTSRKLKPENLFSAGIEANMEIYDDASLLDRVKEMFKKNTDKQTDQNTDFTQAIEAVATEVANLQQQFAELGTGDGKDHSKEIAQLTEQLNSTTQELTELKQKLGNTPNFTQRPPASGGKDQAVTDC